MSILRFKKSKLNFSWFTFFQKYNLFETNSLYLSWNVICRSQIYFSLSWTVSFKFLLSFESKIIVPFTTCLKQPLFKYFSRCAFHWRNATFRNKQVFDLEMPILQMYYDKWWKNHNHNLDDEERVTLAGCPRKSQTLDQV